MRRNILTVVLLFILIIPVAGESWSIGQCLDFALDHNIEVQNAEREMKISGSSLLEAYGNALPSVELSAMKVLEESIVETEMMGMTFETDMQPDYLYQISGTQVLFSGGGVFYNIKNMGKEKEASRIRYDKAVSQVIFDVSEAYYNVIYTSLMERLAAENEDILRRQLEITEARYDNGEASYLDLLQARLELNNAVPMRISAESFKKTALMNLKNIMGTDEAHDISIAEEFDVSEINGGPDKAEALKTAMENNHDLKLLVIREKILKNTETMSKGAYLPSLVLTGSYGQSKEEWDDDWDESYNLSLALSWKLFDGFSREKNLASVKQNRYMVEDAIADVRHKVEMDINMKHEAVEESQERMSAGETGLDLANETLEMAQKSYEEGLVSLIEMMQAKVGYNSAKASYIKAQYDYNLSMLNLKKSMGTLSVKEEK